MEDVKIETNDKNKKHPFLGWIGAHSDAVMVMGTIIGSLIWMNGEFNEIKKDIAVIKTVLIMKNIMPDQLVCKPELKSEKS